MNFRRFQFVLFSVVVSVGIFAYLFSKVDFIEVITVVKNIPLTWLWMFILFSLSMSVFRTWRYKLLLASSGYETQSLPLFLITLVRNLFSDLLPARLGTFIYVYLIRSRLNIPLAPALSSFAYDFIFDIISLSFLLLPAAIIASFEKDLSFVILLAGILLGIISLIILFILPQCVRFAARITGLLTVIPDTFRAKIYNGLLDTEKHLLLAGEKGIYWRVLALSFGVRCSKYLALYVLLMGLVFPLGYKFADFPLAKVFLALCSAELAVSLPISGIAGFGVYEGAWSLVFQLLGYPERVAIITGISHHLITQLWAYGLGALCLVVLLMPFFKESECKRQRSSRFSVKNERFWIKYTFTILSVVLVAGFLSAAASGRISGEMNESGSGYQGVGDGSGTDFNISNMAGMIVYERPNGIWLIDITSGKNELLIERGRRPRWSPDGESIVYILENSIMIYDFARKGSRKIVHSAETKAVCFTPDGESVLFTDDGFLRKVDRRTLHVTDLLNDERVFELDISGDGKWIGVTVKSLMGYKVKIYDYQSLRGSTVAKGCSASLSPDGRLVTVLDAEHEKLLMYSTDSLNQTGYVPAPQGMQFDNQIWSNHQDWLVSTSEGEKNNIYIHNTHNGSFRQITFTGDCDRGDLFVSKTGLNGH